MHLDLGPTGGRAVRAPEGHTDVQTAQHLCQDFHRPWKETKYLRFITYSQEAKTTEKAREISVP